MTDWFTHVGGAAFTHGHHYRDNDCTAVRIWLPPDVALATIREYQAPPPAGEARTAKVRVGEATTPAGPASTLLLVTHTPKTDEWAAVSSPA